MKKFILVSLSIVLLCSFVWADQKVSLVKEYDEIPIELRGTWYTLQFSTDEGVTQDETYRPLLVVTQRYLGSKYYDDRIVRVELFSHRYGPSYFLFSEETNVFYMVIFYIESPDTPVVYMYKNGKEQYRSCFKIIRI